MVMSMEILLLAVMGGMTLLAYMIAINAHGSVRLSLSYLLATVVLAGTVWATVQYVNSTVQQKQQMAFSQLAAEKQLVEEQVRTQQVVLDESKEQLAFSGKLNSVITRAAAMASSMIGKEMQDRSADLNTLIGRSVDAVQKAAALKNELAALKPVDGSYAECLSLMNEGMTLLNEATYYYKLYYYSEDSAQEDVRGRVMRQKAQAAYDRFQKASSLIAGSGS